MNGCNPRPPRRPLVMPDTVKVAMTNADAVALVDKLADAIRDKEGLMDRLRESLSPTERESMLLDIRWSRNMMAKLEAARTTSHG